jgi:hypothetical protein
MIGFTTSAIASNGLSARTQTTTQNPLLPHSPLLAISQKTPPALIPVEEVLSLPSSTKLGTIFIQMMETLSVLQIFMLIPDIR